MLRAQRKVSSVFIPLPGTDICLRQNWGLSLRMPAFAQYPLSSIVYTALNSWMGCTSKVCKAFEMWSILFHKNRSEWWFSSMLMPLSPHRCPKSFWFRCPFYLTSVHNFDSMGKKLSELYPRRWCFFSLLYKERVMVGSGCFHLIPFTKAPLWGLRTFQIFRIGGGGRRVSAGLRGDGSGYSSLLTPCCSPGGFKVELGTIPPGTA